MFDPIRLFRTGLQTLAKDGMRGKRHRFFRDRPGPMGRAGPPGEMLVWSLTMGALLTVSGCHRAPAPFTPEPNNAVFSQGWYHRVQKGERLRSVAGYHRRSTQLLARFNDLRPPYELRPNTHLYIPPTNDQSVLERPGISIEGIRAGRLRQDQRLAGAPDVKRAPKRKYRLPSSVVERKPTTRSYKRRVGAASTSTIRSRASSASAARVMRPGTRKRSRPSTKVKKPATPRPKPSRKYALPLSRDGFRYVREFSDSDWRKPHRGVDLAAPRGTPVRAVANGVVLQADEMGSYGQLVVVDHEDGYSSLYAHVAKRMLVREGQQVKQGQTIARVDSTGGATGPHLHLEIRYNETGDALDPIEFLSGLGRVVSQ